MFRQLLKFANFYARCYNQCIMKIETHLHSKYGSPCGQMDFPQILQSYKDLGYDCIVITEHFDSYIFREFLPQGSYEQKVDIYWENYKRFKLLAKEFGILILFGAEITFRFIDNMYAHILVYGADDKFFKDKNIFELSYEDFYKYSRKRDVFLVQAHPFRLYVKQMPLNLLDAIEVYNGGDALGGNSQNNQKALELAEKNNFKQFSGSDFHLLNQAGRGGIVAPDNITNNRQLVQFLRNNQPKLIIGGEIQ